MIFRNNLYKVISYQQTETGAQFTIELNADHIIYKAHFPNYPITPGVCLLQIAKELLESFCDSSLTITFLKNVKFLSTVSPNEHLRIDYIIDNIQIQADSIMCRSQVKSQEGMVMAKMSFKCKRL